MNDQIKTAAEAAENDALPRRFEKHTDDTKGRDERTEGLGDKPAKAKSPAEWAYERLILYIQNFEEQLDNEHEVAMGFTGGDAGVLKIEGMGFFDPDIVTFYGSDPAGGLNPACAACEPAECDVACFAKRGRGRSTQSHWFQARQR